MRTLVLSPRYTDDSNAMWRAATDRGWDVVRVRSYRPDAIDPAVAKKSPLLYGETLLADALAEPLGLVVVEPSPTWLPSLPEAYRKRQVQLSTLGKARLVRTPQFVKPVDEKIFKSRVYDDGAMIDPDLALDDGEPVHVSEVVRFELEVRLFVANRRVHTYSAYLRDGAIAKDAAGEWPLSDAEAKEAMRFANALLGDAQVDLPEALVVDVGRTRDRGWCVVEANPCWASGLCGCDPRAALDVCAVASKPKHEPSRWSRQPKG
ncbi:MAG: ATP-grasp domain-containing protein [Sandaracinaceae bacterium]|nr:ATP-grasp domain-containing protein [Sandaracinaceae bacterium]